MFLWFISILISFAILYLFFALFLGIIPKNKNFIQAKQGTEIFISSNGVHVDIIMPVTTKHMDWRHLIPPGDFLGPVAYSPFIGFGWGEKNFYINTPTWADLQPAVAIKAMLWPTDAAMHVSYYRGTPQSDKNTIAVILRNNELELLVSYIHNSFQMNEQKTVLIEGASYDMHDNFYEANGQYHMFFTSNDWVNEALKTTGLRAAVWSPFDKAVMYQLWRATKQDQKLLQK